MMLFTTDTLHSSCKAFGQALKKLDLTLNLSSTKNVWARILANRNYSALMAYLKSNGSLRLAFDPSHMISVLKTVNRTVGRDLAIELFTDATRDILSSLALDLYVLVNRSDEKSFYGVYFNQRDNNSRYLLGLMQFDEPGYLVMSACEITRFNDKAEGDLIADLLNAYGKKGSGDHKTKIFAQNLNTTEMVKDRNLLNFFLEQREIICQQLAADLWGVDGQRVLRLMDINDIENIENVLFDSMANMINVHQAEHRTVFINPDSPLAKVFYANCVRNIIDHVNWFRDTENTPEEIDHDSIYQTIEICLNKILNIAELRNPE